MMVSAVPSTIATKILENALSPLTMIDAVITTNVPSIDVPQPDAPTLQLFVTMVMLVPLINVIQELENAFTPQFQPRIQTAALSKLVMLRKESSTLQGTVMMVLLAQLILAIKILDAPTLQVTVSVMTRILAPLIPAFKERDASTLQ
jgi:hypothetical protein